MPFRHLHPLFSFSPLLLLTLAALTCQTLSPTPGPTTGEFEGYYSSGFEVSAFVPCDGGEPAPGFVPGYWLNGTSDFYDQYDALVESSDHDPITGSLSVYVRFNGELSPPGHYGHLGAYEREITVTELLEMSLDGLCPGDTPATVDEPTAVVEPFKGYYASGEEISSFVPCGMDAQPGYGHGYWLESPNDFHEQYRALLFASGVEYLTGDQAVYVVFEGELSPEGQYRHVGAYEREVTVIKLLEMSLNGTCP
ncbi:MAG: hypothetical protein Fur0022_27290 [Anaerolineales bacterium]